MNDQIIVLEIKFGEIVLSVNFKSTHNPEVYDLKIKKRRQNGNKIKRRHGITGENSSRSSNWDLGKTKSKITLKKYI